MQSKPEIQKHTTLCGCDHATRLMLENMRTSLVKYTLFRRLWRKKWISRFEKVDYHNSGKRKGLKKSWHTGIEAIMALMEMSDVFNIDGNGRCLHTRHAKWMDIAAKVWLEDGSKQVCRLKQTYTPIGADRKNFTIITNVFLLNYAVSLDQACDGSKNNTWGVWPWKFPIDNLPSGQVCSSWQVVACTHVRLECTTPDMSVQPRRYFPSTVSG